MNPDAEDRQGQGAPASAAVHLSRPRLLELLQGSGREQLTLLVAPAGFGKTTLLAEFTRTVAATAAWLTLNEWDRDPETLAGRLFATLAPALSTPASAPAPSPHVERRSWAGAVAHRLVGALSAQPLALVIDDYQEIEGSQASRSLIEALLSHLPAHVRVFIGSRSVPDLAAFSRKLARGEAAVIDAASLRFTPVELGQLARAAGSLQPRREAQRLWELTEGWPAAAAIAVRTAARGPGPGPGSPDVLLRLLCEEALGRLTPDQQQVLRLLCVLDQMTEGLCAAMPGLTFPDGLAHWLDECGLPVSASQEAAGPVYRFHPVVREYLLRRLRADEAAYRRSEVAAAQACLELGADLQAVQHYQRAGETEEVRRLVPEVVGRLLRTGRWASAVQLFEQMPARWPALYPELQLWRAHALFWSGDSEGALGAIAAVLGATPDPRVRAQALTLRAGALRKKGEFTAARSACYEALRIVEEHRLGSKEEFEARREFGFTLGMQGDLSQAAEQLNHCLRYFETEHDLENAARIRDGLGVMHGQLGDLPLAAVHLRKALACWERLDNPAAACNTLNNLGMVLYKRGEPEEARAEFGRALEAARRGGNRHIEGFVECSLGDLDLDAGRHESALERFRRAAGVARDLDSSTMGTYALGGIGLAYLGQGLLAKAEVTLAEAAADARLRGAHGELARVQVLLARTRQAQGNPGAAEVLLEEAIDLARSAGVPEEQMRAHLWLAEGLFRRGLKARAVEELAAVEQLLDSAPLPATLQSDLSLMAELTSYAASRLPPATLPRLLARTPLAAAAPERRPDEGVEVYLLGAVRARAGDRWIDTFKWRTHRARELFAYLLLHPGVSREEICADLWPDDPPETVGSVFRVTLYRLRRAIQPLRISSRERDGHFELEGAVWCDAVEFRRLLRRARETREEEQRHLLLQSAVDLYHGPLALEFRSEWAEEERTTLEASYIAALAELAERAGRLEQHDPAVRHCERILEVDPLNEPAALQLMSSWIAQGKQAAALHLFHQYTRRLQEEGLPPSPAIIRIYRERLATH